MSNPAILVTGSTGLLGSHLLYELARSGRPVRAIYRSEEGRLAVRRIFAYYHDNPADLYNRVEWVKADLMDLDSLEKALEGIRELYHCAAMVSFDPRDRNRMLRVNTDGTANLVNLAIRAQIEAFCHVSSIATLTRPDPALPADEESYWIRSSRNSVYSVSKFGAEREVWRGMEEGLPAVIVNPSVILGPGFWQGNSALFTLAARGLKYYPNGSNGFVDVRDVALAMTGLTGNRHFGRRFVVSAENLSYLDLLTRMSAALGQKAPSVRVGRISGGLAWRGARALSLLTGKPPVITRETVRSSSQDFACSSSRLISTLNFRFRPVDDTIAGTCRLFLNDRAAGIVQG